MAKHYLIELGEIKKICCGLDDGKYAEFNPYFWSVGLPNVGIKLLKSPHASIFSHPKILFLVPLLFVASIPTYLLNFNFLIILV